MALYNDYLMQFNKQGITDLNKLQSGFDKGMTKLSGTTDQIAFKNAYEDYKKNLGTNVASGNTGIVNPGTTPMPTVTGMDSAGNSIYDTGGTGGTNDIVKNNKVMTGGSTTDTSLTTEKVKTPLELAQEEIVRKQSEIDKKNKEYEVLQNKGAESELNAGVIPGGGNKQTDFLNSTNDWLQTNLTNELANLDKQKQDLQDSIKGGQLSEEDQKTTLQPYEQFLDKVTKLKDINDTQIQRDQTDLKNRYSQTIDRQKQANELALINAQKIAAITGVGFTSGGIQGIGNIIEEGNQAITSLEQDRESMISKYKDADSKLDIEYLDTITTIGNESKKALQDRYNSVITQIQKIDAEKGKATKEGLLAIKDVAKEYFDALDSQWNKDYKVMEFNYNSMLNYKKDLREQDKLEQDNQKSQLDMITKGDLTSLTDKDIITLVNEMGLDTTTAKGLILQREKQKKEAQIDADKQTFEENKFEASQQMTPYQKAQYDMDLKKYGLDIAKQNFEQKKFNTEQGLTATPTGSLEDFQYGNKNITLDSGALQSFKNAINNMPGTIVGSTLRTTEEQNKLYDAYVAGTGGKANVPGTSLHEKGMAIDIYGGQDKNGKLLKPTAEQIKTMNANGWFQTAGPNDMGHFEYKGVGGGEVELTLTDISKFNNSTFKPNTLKTQSDIKKYELYQNKVDEIFNNPTSDFYDVIGLSQGSGKGSVSERDKIGKYAQVLGGLDSLTGLVKSQETGPIVGRLKQLNPYSTDVAAFKAEIAGLVPTVARGIFNEVGVLTDSDVERYLLTLPTLEKTSDQNKLVIGALLTTLRNGMKSQLDTMARSGVDVSKFEGSIKKMDTTISDLEKGIGKTGTTPKNQSWQDFLNSKKQSNKNNG